jgi:alkylation response protein AidB-like acyl-CoA dehydrogenase
MLVTLSSDQEVLRATTARFLDDHMPVNVIRGLRDDPVGFDAKYWARGAELGWASLLVGEENGGGAVSGAALTDLGLIAHEFGLRAAPGPLVPVNVVAYAIAAAGAEGRADVLADLMSGTATAAWGYAEPPPGDQLGEIALDIRSDGESVVLSGVKRPVDNAATAEHLLVTGRTGNGLTQVLVPAGTAGVTITPLTSADLTRRFATARFDDVRLPADAVVGDVGGAAEQVQRQRQVATLLHGAESVGAMQRAFEMTQAWATDRYSFGRPLSSYQEIKHRFADMLTWLEGSHAINDAATAAFDAGGFDVEDLTSAAAAFIGEYGGELLQDCVQIHGGIGVTFEHDLHLFLRRVSVNRATYGTPGEHRRLLGRVATQRAEVVGVPQ